MGVKYIDYESGANADADTDNLHLVIRDANFRATGFIEQVRGGGAEAYLRTALDTTTRRHTYTYV